MGKITSAFSRMITRRGSSAGTPGTHSFGTPATLIAAVAVVLTVGASDGTAALWIRSATTDNAATVTAGRLGVTVDPLSLTGLAASYTASSATSTAGLSRSSFIKVTNTSNVDGAVFAPRFSLPQGSNNTLANGTVVTVWPLTGSTDPSLCTTNAVPADAYQLNWQYLAAVTMPTFVIDRVTPFIYCIRTEVRPSVLLTNATLKIQFDVTATLPGTQWSVAAAPISVTQSATGVWGNYAKSVRSAGATAYWPLAESGGNRHYDWVGAGTDYDAIARQRIGTAVAGMSAADGAASFSGVAYDHAATQTAIAFPAAKPFTVEAWIKTSSTTGGRIVGFGSAFGDSVSVRHDRHLYMGNDGRVSFGVYNGTTNILSTTSALNDNAWHHVVGTMDTTGMTLWVDGARVATSTNTTAEDYPTATGYWRIGGDASWGSSDQYFDGVIDDVAVYPTALAGSAIRQNWTVSGRVAPANTAYSAAVNADQPRLYWRLADTGSTVADTSPYARTGTYFGGATKSVAGAITGNTAVRFDGSTGYASTNAIAPAPGFFSLELWFSTTTTAGGKLVGYGSSTGPSSGSYDRHVVMGNDGRLHYGIWAGAEQVITTPAAYNDGKWHHLVVVQGPQGASLYLDGALVGSRADMTTPQTYDGYWHIGADNVWGSSGATSKFFAGTIDEVAVYDSQLLSEARISAHYNAAW